MDVCTQICGDGIILGNRPTNNYCDDGGLINGDGCNKGCTVENGWACSGGNSTSPDICIEICGDAQNHGGVQCDDGNLANGDGCSHVCILETGFIC